MSELLRIRQELPRRMELSIESGQEELSIVHSCPSQGFSVRFQLSQAEAFQVATALAEWVASRLRGGP